MIRRARDRQFYSDPEGISHSSPHARAGEESAPFVDHAVNTLNLSALELAAVVGWGAPWDAASEDEELDPPETYNPTPVM